MQLQTEIQRYVPDPRQLQGHLLSDHHHDLVNGKLSSCAHINFTADDIRLVHTLSK